ncbi:MAG TPA: hypothetical protein VNF00_04870 [Candidatus Acidoferrales bacterium]|nr:hypothetical protein [Candidatus Acidoferrales bacterium]
MTERLFVTAAYIPPVGFLPRLGITAAVYAFVLFAGGYVIRRLTRPLIRGDARPTDQTAAELRNAGMYIGWLERFLILTALLLRSPATAGLVLTAKAIARFPEFKHVHFAEYFLIGTLLILGITMIGGLILLKLLHGSISIAP